MGLEAEKFGTALAAAFANEPLGTILPQLKFAALKPKRLLLPFSSIIAPEPEKKYNVHNVHFLAVRVLLYYNTGDDDIEDQGFRG